MADVEVHQAGYFESFYNGDDDNWFFEMAKFLSGSAHFSIIDSYSSHWNEDKAGGGSYVTERYKGDPIADDDPSQPGYKYWESVDDVGNDNDWFILECQTENPTLAAMGYSGLPKWQLKIQLAGRGNNFADVSDPSGTTYPKNHNSEEVFAGRFAPWGGWDLADSAPDFATSPGDKDSTENHKIVWSMDDYIVFIAADGILIGIQRDGTGDYHKWNLYVGDVIPPSTAHMSNPRAFKGMGGTSYEYLYINNDGGALKSCGSWSNSGDDYEISDSNGGGFAFWDHDDNIVESAYQTPRIRSLPQTFGNHQSDDMEIDTLPVLVIPKKGLGLRFALSHIRQGLSRGKTTYENGTLMTGWENWTMFFPWDGSKGVM